MFPFFCLVEGGKGYPSDNGQGVGRLSSTVSFFYAKWTGSTLKYDSSLGRCCCFGNAAKPMTDFEQCMKCQLMDKNMVYFINSLVSDT